MRVLWLGIVYLAVGETCTKAFQTKAAPQCHPTLCFERSLSSSFSRFLSPSPKLRSIGLAPTGAARDALSIPHPLNLASSDDEGGPPALAVDRRSSAAAPKPESDDDSPSDSDAPPASDSHEPVAAPTPASRHTPLKQKSAETAIEEVGGQRSSGKRRPSAKSSDAESRAHELPLKIDEPLQLMKAKMVFRELATKKISEFQAPSGRHQLFPVPLSPFELCDMSEFPRLPYVCQRRVAQCGPCEGRRANVL